MISFKAHKRKFRQPQLIIFVFVLAITSLPINRDISEAHAQPLPTIGGALIPTAKILGDTSCVLTSVGLIRCGLQEGTETVFSDLGPLTGQTLLDYSGDYSTQCAINSEYKAFCWGANGRAAVGDNTTTRRDTPTAVYTGGPLAGVQLKKIATNQYGSCAVSLGGALYCWGESTPGGGGGIYDRFYTGQLQSTHLIPPTAVSDSRFTTKIWADVEAVSYNGTCAMAVNGTFMCFGGGISTYTTSAIPVGESVVSMSAKYESSNVHACALTDAGKVYCNGTSYFAEATSTFGSNTFGLVSLPALATSVRVTDGVACAVLNNGGVSCWGVGMNRTIGLGRTGYPVVTLLPAGSSASEAVPFRSYSYPVIMVRKSDGQILNYVFKTFQADSPLPIAVDHSVRTQVLQLPNVFTDSEECESPTYLHTCLFISSRDDTMDSVDVVVRVYSDSSLTLLESSFEESFRYGRVLLGTVNGTIPHWVTVTAISPYGNTTSAPIEIAQEYSPPLVTQLNPTTGFGAGCFELIINPEFDDGGFEGDWSFVIRNTQTGTSIKWSGRNSCVKSLKTSSSYKITGTITTRLGSSSATSTFTTQNARPLRKLYRNSRYPMRSVFQVNSTGRQTWSATGGCFIRGGYLYTGRTASCSIKLKVGSAKGYRSTTNTYFVSVLKKT